MDDGSVGGVESSILDSRGGRLRIFVVVVCHPHGTACNDLAKLLVDLCWVLLLPVGMLTWLGASAAVVVAAAHGCWGG